MAIPDRKEPALRSLHHDEAPPDSETRRSRGTSEPSGLPHPSVVERAARGKALRAEVPRAKHGDFRPATDRADAVSVLERQGQSRVLELLPIRYARMLASPLAFYRGAAAIMAADLARLARTGLEVQLCGDAHLSNFGAFASPERRLTFDVNDFDETARGPWEWDVERLAASLAVAGRDNGFSRKEREMVVLRAVGHYRQAMRQFAAMTNLDVWYARFDVDERMRELRAQLAPRRAARAERGFEKARTHDRIRALGKLTRLVGDELRIVSAPPLVVPVEELYPSSTAEELTEVMREFLRGYRRSLQSDRRTLLESFRFVHLARKVVGVGSVGTRAWIALFLGRDQKDPLFLQVKEAQRSVLEDFVSKSPYVGQGERVVAGQHAMQAVSDIFLGWHRMRGQDGVLRDFYVRQLQDWKGSVDIAELEPKTMAAYAQMCSWTLARAHARSGDRIAIAAYMGKSDVFERALVDFAEAYADQNERDYQALAAAGRSGRIDAHFEL